MERGDTYTSRVSADCVVSGHMHTPVVLLGDTEHIFLELVDGVALRDERIRVIVTCLRRGIAVDITSETARIGARSVRARVGRNIRQDFPDWAQAHSHTVAC